MAIPGSEEFDVMVVGGGPAGSTVAALVAMQGHRVLILEREKFPRYQIGESLLPSTIHGVCRLLGVTDQIDQAGFTRKRGGTFKWGASPEPWKFAFAISPKMAGRTSHAYQVERSKFDKILLDNARRVGVDVREMCSVSEVIDNGGQAQEVRYSDAEGQARQALAKYVVDASGNKSRIYRGVGGERQYSDFFRNLALFGYFENGKRLAPPDEGNIFCVAFDSGWFWYIPLSPTLTSVGAVVRKELAPKIQGNPEKMMHALIGECPVISDYLADATRVTTGEYGQLRVRKDYSYHHTKFWRPGMVLVGDAACFVDPVFSSGVHLATYGGLLAARSINSVLAGRVNEKAAFEEFETRYRREYRVFYEFLTAFYDMHANEDSYFWNAMKVTNSTSSDLEAFVDLVGGVSSGEHSLTDAESVAQRFKTKAAELATAVEGLEGKDKDDMVPLFKPTVVREVLEVGAQIQTQALLGEDAEPEEARYPGGLIASPDGMFWTVPEEEWTGGTA
jgi:halogenation protein CepH